MIHLSGIDVLVGVGVKVGVSVAVGVTVGVAVPVGVVVGVAVGSRTITYPATCAATGVPAAFNPWHAIYWTPAPVKAIVAVNSPFSSIVAVPTGKPPARIPMVLLGSPVPLRCSSSPTTSCDVAMVHCGGIKVFVAVSVGVLVGVAVAVLVGVAVSVAVAVGVAVSVGVTVSVDVAVAVAVLVGVAVAVGIGVSVTVGVGVTVAVLVVVAVGSKTTT